MSWNSSRGSFRKTACETFFQLHPGVAPFCQEEDILEQQEIRRQEEMAIQVASTQPTDSLVGKYLDPVEYAEKVLKITLIPIFQTVLRSLLTAPQKTMVLSGHNIGKSHCAAVAINWFFDTFDPSQCITTAPTKDSVEKVLWKQVRLQRMRAGLPDVFIGPSAPEMKTSQDHIAYGFTAKSDTAMAGRHDLRQLLVIDEAVGVPPIVWQVFKSMFNPAQGHMILATMNPTDTASQAFIEDEGGKWRVFNVSSLEHPNIALELAGRQPLIPEAVSVDMVDEWVHDWCDPITEADGIRTEVAERQPDVLWKGQWYRPSLLFESRVLGVWPTMATAGVWSQAIWQRITSKPAGRPWRLDVPVSILPEIGCDVAYHGDDNTAIFVRWGPCGMHSEEANGWDHVKTADRLIELAKIYAAKVTGMRQSTADPIDPKRIRIKVDDDGQGGGVISILRRRGYNAIGIHAGGSAFKSGYYPNKRSELWFQVRDAARDGNIDLSRLGEREVKTLKQQAMAVEYKLDSFGCRVVEPKQITKEKLRRSPDTMDAMNLAWYEGGDTETASYLVDEPERRTVNSRVWGSQTKGIWQ